VLNSATSIKLPGDDGNTTWFRRTRGKLDRVGCTAAKEASYFPLQSPTVIQEIDIPSTWIPPECWCHGFPIRRPCEMEMQERV
jgi:hypothetical protein